MQLGRSFSALHSLSAPQVLWWSVYLTNYGYCKHPSSPEMHRRQSSLWARYIQPTLSSSIPRVTHPLAACIYTETRKKYTYS